MYPVTYIVQPLVNNTKAIMYLHFDPLEFTSTSNGCINIYVCLLLQLNPIIPGAQTGLVLLHF
jgi:hypothetical protein